MDIRRALRNFVLMLIVTSLGPVEHSDRRAYGGQTGAAKELADGYPLRNSSSEVRGAATLRVMPLRAMAGAAVQLEVIFRVGPESGSGYVFNPFQMPLLPSTADICCYDSNGKLAYVWDWRSPSGSRVAVSANSWVWLAPGACAGFTRSIRIPSATTATLEGNGLKAGKYYLQAIYAKAFIGLSSTKGSPHVCGPLDGDKLNAEFDNTELFRSNAVEVEVIE